MTSTDKAPRRSKLNGCDYESLSIWRLDQILGLNSSARLNGVIWLWTWHFDLSDALKVEDIWRRKMMKIFGEGRYLLVEKKKRKQKYVSYFAYIFAYTFAYTGWFFYCSALKFTKYKEKLKYLNCSASCYSQKVSTFSKITLKKLKYLNCSYCRIGTVWIL